MNLQRFIGKEFILGLALWLFSTAYFSHVWMLIIPIVLFFYYAKQHEFQWRTMLKECNRVHLLFIGSFVMLSAINDAFNGPDYCSVKDIAQPYFIWPLIIVTAHLWNFNAMSKGWMFGMLIEVLIALLERMSGYASIGVSMEIRDVELWYNFRVNGLSASSSVFAMKIFVSVLMLTALPVSRNKTIVTYAVLMIGIWLTFNRSVLISLLVLVILLIFKDVKKFRFQIGKWKSALPILLFTLFFCILFILNVVEGKNQLNRGGLKEDFNYGNEQAKDSLGLTFEDFQLNCYQAHAFPLIQGVDLDTNAWSYRIMRKCTQGVNTAGRNLIWINYLHYFENHFHTGNGSQKLWMRSVNANKMEVSLMHAHNSFLQLLATNGFWISGMYMLYYVWMWRRSNVAQIGAILVYSFFQFGWGWGFSVMDVLLVYFLITPSIDEDSH